MLFRFLQGVGGAALVPLSQAVLFDINPPKEFGRAMSIWGIGVTLGPILGPALGGWLTDNYSWRWVFFINLPVGVLAYFGLLATMPESRNAKSSRFDFFGFTTLSLGIGCLQMLLDRGQTLRLVLLAARSSSRPSSAGIGFYLFVVHMFTQRAALPEPGAVQGPQLRRLQRLHLRDRRGAVRHPGAAAADAAEPDAVSGGADRPGHHAARASAHWSA